VTTLLIEAKRDTERRFPWISIIRSRHLNHNPLPFEPDQVHCGNPAIRSPLINLRQIQDVPTHPYAKTALHSLGKSLHPPAIMGMWMKAKLQVLFRFSIHFPQKPTYEASSLNE
jgi:hypothetical protein